MYRSKAWINFYERLSIKRFGCIIPEFVEKLAAASRPSITLIDFEKLAKTL